MEQFRYKATGTIIQAFQYQEGMSAPPLVPVHGHGWGVFSGEVIYLPELGDWVVGEDGRWSVMPPAQFEALVEPLSQGEEMRDETLSS